MSFDRSKDTSEQLVHAYTLYVKHATRYSRRRSEEHLFYSYLRLVEDVSEELNSRIERVGDDELKSIGALVVAAIMRGKILNELQLGCMDVLLGKVHNELYKRDLLLEGTPTHRRAHAIAAGLHASPTIRQCLLETAPG